jgi:microcystin-dependent protein
LTVYKWDKAIPANNATADATINWQEGQASSTVNDSARALMTAVAKYRDDIAGTITTGGSSTAYTVATNQGFTTLANLNGAMICFIPHTTSGSGAITMQVDSLGFKPLRTIPGVELVTGQLVAGTPYAMTYDNVSQTFKLQGVPDLSGVTTAVVPIGAIMPYVGASAPSSNFAMCFGQLLTNAAFPALGTVINAAFGGTPGTNFNLPDLRGRVPAGKDDMGGTPAGKFTTAITDDGTITGTVLGSKGGTTQHIITIGEMPSHSHTVHVSDPGHAHQMSNWGPASLGGATTTVIAPSFGPVSTNSSGLNGTGIGVSLDPNGGNNGLVFVQPTIILNYIIRTL